MIKVSVVIPAYNTEKHIESCLKSLEMQTLKDIEFIIVDDGSTDKTAEIADKWAAKDARFRVEHIQNGGAGKARNHGMTYAKGEYIGFVDSDDIVENTMFEKLYEAATKYEVPVAMCNHTDVIKEKSYPYDLPVSEGRIEQEEITKCLIVPLIGGCTLNTTEEGVVSGYIWRMLFKKKFLEENKITFESERVVRYEDLVFVMQTLQKASQIAIVKESLYNYYHRAGSLVYTYKKDVWDRQKELQKALVKLTQHIKTPEVKTRLQAKEIIGLLEAVDHTVGSNSYNVRSSVINSIRHMREEVDLELILEDKLLSSATKMRRLKLRYLTNKNYKKLYYVTYVLCQMKKYRGDIL
ncbi:MAG: glycosyltransferase [Cellulosilyticaceae bacterium]